MSLEVGLRVSRKPVRQCSQCPLNLGAVCWAFENPRERQRRRARCPAGADPEIRRRFEAWRSRPEVKTRSEIRRDACRKRKPGPPRPALEGRA
jgi:hypothetical protein